MTGLVVMAAVAVGVSVGTSSASATGTDDVTAQGCHTVTVSFRDIVRGWVRGCYYPGVDSIGPFVTGWFEVCDVEDEPQETNVVRGEVVAAFSNGSEWRYVSSGWKYAPGDGAGCRIVQPDPYLWDGPHLAGWTARYMKITAEAPGKATAVARPGF
ncbi:MAG: hypothetical protein HOY78_29430 [Saccharothrix sp.]|nr:hypothetical protein [Saccharothrix sp.]